MKNDDLIRRQDVVECVYKALRTPSLKGVFTDTMSLAIGMVNDLPTAQPEDWIERNKERILQAGMEGREIEFRIGGRLFAIREKAQ